MQNLGKPHFVKMNNSQGEAIDVYNQNDITFFIGPPGTAKTHLAVYCALSEISNIVKTSKVERIVIARPVIEAGRQRLGFLPGDPNQKIDPYMRPIHDVVSMMYSPASFASQVIKDHITFEQIAYMRGRTFHRSVLIIDEAQNCTESELKLCLTRLGAHSKAIITGDIGQSDLPLNDQFLDILVEEWGDKKIPGIGIKKFTRNDVVRNKIVKKVIGNWPK